MFRSAHRGILTLIVAFLSVQFFSAAAQAPAPTDVKALIDGTFELVEWYLPDGKILRPPEVGGYWSSYDGILFVTFYRQSEGNFQHLTSYGTYETTATTWKYQYKRTTTANGTTAEDAKVRLTTGLPARNFTITRKGDKIELRSSDAEGLRDYREYDKNEFRYMPREGQPLRVYRRVK